MSDERPYCAATNATDNPRPAMLRSQGALDEGGSHVRLRLTEVPPQSVVRLMAAPAGAWGLDFGIGCLRGPVAQLNAGPFVTDPGGSCTWWLGGFNGAAAFSPGTTWTFQVQAWNAGARIQSNALAMTFR